MKGEKRMYDGNAQPIEYPVEKDGKIFTGFNGKQVASLGIFVVDTGSSEYLWASLNTRTVLANSGPHRDVQVIKAAMEAFSLTRASGLLDKKPGALKALGINKIEKAKLTGKRINVTVGWEESSDISSFVMDCAKADPAKSGAFMASIERALRHESGIDGCTYDEYESMTRDRKAEAKGRASDD